MQDIAGNTLQRRRASIANLRHFQPGQTGNPRGRAKRDLDLAEIARAHTEEAIATLVEIMTDTAASPASRVSAAQALLDRGYGRPPASLDVNHTMTIEQHFEGFIRDLQGSRARDPGAASSSTAISDRCSGEHGKPSDGGTR